MNLGPIAHQLGKKFNRRAPKNAKLEVFAAFFESQEALRHCSPTPIEVSVLKFSHMRKHVCLGFEEVSMQGRVR